MSITRFRKLTPEEKLLEIIKLHKEIMNLQAELQSTKSKFTHNTAKLQRVSNSLEELIDNRAQFISPEIKLPNSTVGLIDFKLLEKLRLSQKQMADCIKKINRQINLIERYLACFFRIEQVKLDKIVVLTQRAIHLYSCITGKSIEQDHNHGHYGMNFDTGMVFCRKWGERNRNNGSRENMIFENYLTILSAN